MSAPAGDLSDLHCAYLADEEILIERPPGGADALLARSAFGRTFPAQPVGGAFRLPRLPVGTHAVELRSPAGAIIAEEFVSIRASPGDDPIVAFATSLDGETVPRSLEWLGRLRATVVQVYDWMERYSAPLAAAASYRDPLGRPIDRLALERLNGAIRREGAIAQAYAPVCAADGEFAGAHPGSRLYRNDGTPQRLGDLLEIMDPGDPDWQRHWTRAYGGAADALGFNGFHLDTYGYPRGARDHHGGSRSMKAGYEEFVAHVRSRRPRDVLSFNQVNGVPRGFAAPARPGFRYVEVWPPNDRWRHLEGLLARSTGDGESCGETLAIYPAVWENPRDAALRTVVLTEAIATVLGAGTLMWGDDRGVLCHPYYVDHERLGATEAEEALRWHRFALRCRDLFRSGLDTSWYELDDENAAVTVVADGEIAHPEPRGGTLFARSLLGEGSVVVSLLDLTGSREGSWSAGTAPGRCDQAEISVLVDDPQRWRACAAVLGHAEGRFEPIPMRAHPHREGRSLSCRVALIDGWSVLRLERVGMQDDPFGSG